MTNLFARQRGSGSTTLMMEDAVRGANAGERVIVFFANRVHANIWRDWTRGRILDPRGSVSCEEVPHGFDWRTLQGGDRHRGLPLGTVYLVDHCAIECALRAAMDMWARYQRKLDNPHLSAEYLARLDNIPAPDRKALLDGAWSASEGEP